MIDRAFAEAERYVGEGRMPGATLGIVTADGMRAVRVAGLAQRVPTPEPLTRDHWFDLASVSKVIATTRFVLQLAEDGRIDYGDGHPQLAPALEQRLEDALEQFSAALARRPRPIDPRLLNDRLVNARWSI